MARRQGHADEQILAALRQAESGATVAEVCRQVGIAGQTFYVYKRKYAGLRLSELWELRQLREENAKLKRLMTDLSLDRHMLQEIVRNKLSRLGTGGGWPAERTRPIRSVSVGVEARADGSSLRAIPKPSGSAGGLTDASPRVGRQSGAVWVSPTHGVVAARGVAGECETDLSALDGRRAGGADHGASEGCPTAPRASGCGHDAEPAVEYGLHEQMGGRWVRILTVVDQVTRECLCLVADQSLTGENVAQA